MPLEIARERPQVFRTSLAIRPDAHLDDLTLKRTPTDAASSTDRSRWLIRASADIDDSKATRTPTTHNGHLTLTLVFSVGSWTIVVVRYVSYGVDKVVTVRAVIID
ncbi:MAG: hypothetical protein ACI8W7_004942 [Gammaproteobacteria bacterium]|jgi:hypothetical protein